MCLRTNKPLWILSLLAASVAAVTSNAMADLVKSGDVSPGGPGGDWSIGSNLDGTVTLSGGSVIASRDIYVAMNYDRIGAHGTMNVTTGATWSNDYILLGAYGTGVLNISSGGQVTTGFSKMGADYFSGANGTANITGSGSSWTLGGTLGGKLSIGGYGIGRLNITNGGVVSNGRGDLGAGPSANGKAIVDGAHSQWNNSGFLNVGNEGTGKLSISNGGTVTSNGAAINYIQNNNDCSVAVTGAHSTWTNTGNLKLRTCPKTIPCFEGGGESCSSTEGRPRGGSVGCF